MSEQHGGRVRAGWTAPATVVGAGLSLIGWWRFKAMSGAHQICHIFRSLQSFAAGSTPGRASSMSCAAIDRQYNIALGLMAIGLCTLGIALVLMTRRARASGSNGMPWWPATVPDRVAEWLNRHLPGSRSRQGPAIRRELVVPLIAVFIIAAGAIGDEAWNKVSRSLATRARHHGEAALTSLTLPAALHREANPSCHPSVDTICAESSLAPAQTQPLLEQLISGRPDQTMCAIVAVPAQQPCPVYGTIGGYRAMAIAFNHLVEVPDGSPAPAGATPVQPGATRLFYKGTDITISLITPRPS